MVRIRYAELPVGLHVATRSNGRYTIVYLLPGLTPAQRRDALTFARRSARIGQGPSLPARDMAVAVVADRLRTTGHNVAAAMRRHPGLLLPPLIVVVSAAIVFVLLSLVTVTVDPASNTRHAHKTQEAPAGARRLPAEANLVLGHRGAQPGAAATPNPPAQVVGPSPPTARNVGVPRKPSPAPQEAPREVQPGAPSQ
jgi:hypothetical protein